MPGHTLNRTRARVRRLTGSLTSLALIFLGLAVIDAAPAFAATSISTPSTNPFTISLDGSGNALPFDVTASGYPSGQSVLIEICDGQPSTSAGWSPTTNCDLSTSPSAVPANSSGSASFPASNRNTAIKDVHGQGPGDVFNCLTQTEINNSGPGTTPGQFPGEYTLDPNYTSTPTGQLVDPNVPAWTNCQLRASTNNSSVTSDQALITLTIPNPAPADTVSLGETPSSPQNAGTPITLTATVTPSGSTAGLTGTLAFTATSGGNTTTICSGVAPSPGTCTWTPTTAATYNLVATYSGDSVYPTESSSGVSYVINATGPAITTPSANPFTISLDGSGNALPFDVVASGYPSGQLVLIEICDGQPSTSPGWSPTTNCDISTSPSAVPASSTGSASFPASNRNTKIIDFNGRGPGDVFNCLSQQQINSFGDATAGQFPGEWTLGPNDVATVSGQTVDPNLPAWTNCQLRASTNNSSVTADQVFDTLTIPNPAPPTDTVSLHESPASPQNAGTPITLTATVTPSGSTAGLTGTLAFTATSGGNTTTICSGVAPSPGTCTWTPTTAATYNLVATYSGDSVYPTESSSGASYVINAIGPAITTPSTNPFTISLDGSGNALPFDVTASGYPSGQSVLIEICDGQPSTSAGWSPTTNCDISTSPSAVPASSTGSASFPASSRNTAIVDFNGRGPSGVFNCLSQQQINSFGDATAGQFPGEWMLGPNDTATVSGQAVDPNLPAWTNCQLRASTNNSSVTADQVFDTLTIPSQGTNPVTVSLQPDHSSPQPALTPITLTATVTPNAGGGPAVTGAVTFFDGATPISAACTNVAISAPTCRWVPSSQGSHSLTVQYSGDPFYQATRSPSVSFDISKLTSSVTLSYSPTSNITQGDVVTITADTTGAGSVPSGFVRFTSNGTSIVGCESQPLNQVGKAFCETTLLDPGTDVLASSYGGDSTYSGSDSNQALVTVSLPPLPARASPTLILTSSPQNPSPGGLFDLILSVYGAGLSAPTGTAEFYSNGQPIPGCLSVQVSNGLALCRTSFQTGGTFRMTAAYSGDASYLPAISAPDVIRVPQGGYWMVASDGGVLAFGGAKFLGSLGGRRLAKPIVGMAGTPDGQGYWLVASDGGIFAFGDAKFLGSLGAAHLTKPIVGMAATADGQGYWLVASDGGIFAFGDAAFRGSLGGLHLRAPIIGIAPTPSGHGYWLAASDGGVFNFGDAPFLGSLGARNLTKPIVAISSPDGRGFWLAASDGGVFGFGDAKFRGSAGGIPLASPVTSMAAVGGAYRLFAADGGVFDYGGLPFVGSAQKFRLTSPIIAATTAL